MKVTLVLSALAAATYTQSWVIIIVPICLYLANRPTEL
jgi:hypothetical protein